MADRKENLKSLFSNTRTRLIIVFTFVVLLIAMIVGYVKLRSDHSVAFSSELANAPAGIRSIPGVLDPTAQYAKLQEQQNIAQAKKAETTGASAIPTIIRTQAIGQGVGVIGSQSGVGFVALSEENQAGSPRSLWIQLLQNGHCSKAAIEQVINQGAQLSDVHAACSCVQIKDTGYGLQQLETVCACKELKAAGYNARQLKDAGYSAGRLRECGFDACELRNAGFTAQQMKDGGFSDGELKGAGFSDAEIAQASGLPDGITAAEVRNAGCNAVALSKLRESGVSAAAIRRISGCSAEQLKAAGFTARELRDAGFSAADLRKAGFSPEQLKAAGYSARDLLNAGFTPAQLANAGYSEAQIKAAEAELPPGISAADVKNAGCDIDELERERKAGVSATLISQYAGCSARALKEAGFTDADLANAGFTPQEINGLGSPVSDAAIKAAGCDPNKLKQLFADGVSATRIKELNGCSAQALKEAGYSASDLLNAGFTPAQLAAAGFTPQQINAAEQQTDAAIKAAGCDPNKLKQLLADGVSATRIKELNGCSAQALKEAGYSARDLLNAGFTPAQLAAAGFTPQQINAAEQQADAAIKAAGCDPNKLKQLLADGVSATRIKELNGCSARALKEAGYSARDLLKAGFTPAQLVDAGFTPQQINAAEQQTDAAIKAAGCDPNKLKQLFAEGVSAARIKELNGCSAQALKEAGYSAKALMNAGFTPAQLLAAGFSPKQLEDAGVNPADILAAGRTADCSVAYLQQAKAAGLSALTIKQTLGCSASALKAAGYTAQELKAAGFTAAELKDAGFSAQQLKAAGFSAKELKDAGFSAAQLKAAGFSAKELKDAGFSAADLKNAGFSAAELKAAGFSAAELKDAGFSAADLKNAGFSAKDLKDAGFSAADLRNAGFSSDQLAAAGFSPQDSMVAGLDNPSISQPASSFPAFTNPPAAKGAAGFNVAANNAQLQEILNKQNNQMAEQKYDQKIQQRTSDMVAAANTMLQGWKQVGSQSYSAGTATEKKDSSDTQSDLSETSTANAANGAGSSNAAQQRAVIKTGDIMFAVMDTAVNSDQPGPILATIVSGNLKGAKLIGSFNLSPNSDTMTISFNTMSVPGAAKTISISSYAIDPNTARTALSSRTDHHYLMRYGSLFASSFLEGFGNAFQSANTTVTIGGTGGGNNVTVQNGVGRSTLENAVIGLSTVGKSWGQATQQLFNTPTTVEVYAGTGIGVLFTQDVTTI